jgi:hypothetical protein
MNGLETYVDRIRPDSYGITTYLENLRRGEYQVPTFQRGVVWDRDRAKRLWDSIYKFYPLGSILVWRTDVRLQNHRQIGGHPLPDDEGIRDFQYLLDGQQRTTALLTSIYGGHIEGREGEDLQLYVDLTVAGTDEVEDQSWRARFLFWDEIDDRNGELLRNTGRQKNFDNGLIVKLEDIAHRCGPLDERLEETGYRYRDTPRAQLHRIRQVLDNYKLSFIELWGIGVAEVCQIFERINQAGQPLIIFDIVVAKTFRSAGEKPGFYLRGLFESFRHGLTLKGSGYSAVDDITLLRVVAVLVQEALPDAGIHNITERYLNELRTEHLESVWHDSEKAIKDVFNFLDNHLHLPGPQLVPYVYFYMSLAAYFFRQQEPDYSLLKKYFWYCSFHSDDLLSNTTQLRDHVRKLRDAKNGTTFVFDRFLIDREKLRTTTYSSRGRLSLCSNQNLKEMLTTCRYSLIDAVPYNMVNGKELIAGK